MSIASYRMATSPTDQNNQNVIAFLDRLQSSVPPAGTSADAFKLDSRGERHSGESDEEWHDAGANELTERGSAGQDEDNEPLKDAEDTPQALPDQTVPLGLLAKLSLENSRRRPRKSGAKPKENESSDDDVVRIPRMHARVNSIAHIVVFQGVANETFFEPGQRGGGGYRCDCILTSW